MGGAPRRRKRARRRRDAGPVCPQHLVVQPAPCGHPEAGHAGRGRATGEDRAPLQDAALSDQHRPELGLRRRVCGVRRTGDRRPRPDEPDRARRRRAGLRGHPARRDPEATLPASCRKRRAVLDRLHRRGAEFQPHRQHRGARLRAQSLRQPLPDDFGDGGRPRHRRGAAHRIRPLPGSQDHPPVSVRDRPLPRRDLHAVEFRDRHQARVLAAPGSGVLLPVHRAVRRGRGSARRHSAAAQAQARPDPAERVPHRQRSPGAGGGRAVSPRPAARAGAPDAGSQGSAAQGSGHRRVVDVGSVLRRFAPGRDCTRDC